MVYSSESVFSRFLVFKLASNLTGDFFHRHFVEVFVVVVKNKQAEQLFHQTSGASSRSNLLLHLMQS